MKPKKRIDVQIEIAKAVLMEFGRSNRETWIAHLVDDRGANLDSAVLFDIPFPTLSPGEMLPDYLVRTWHACEQELELRDRLRSAVVNLIRGECDNESVSNPDNVLGRLLIVARDCKFTEIESKLWAWICADAYPDETCWDGVRHRTLRSLVWSTLLTWDLRPEWLPKLATDLAREDCRARCFAALAKLKPREAVPYIPSLLRLQPAYSRGLITDLIKRLGPEAALGPDMPAAWESCLSEIENDDDLRHLLRPEGFGTSVLQGSAGTTLWRALGDGGIHLGREGDVVTLRTDRLPSPLKVLLPRRDIAEEAIRITSHAEADFEKLCNDLDVARIAA
jgi:hypothetical protein